MVSKGKVEEFLKALLKLEMKEFFGVAKLMGISLVKEVVEDEEGAKPVVKTGEELIEEMATKFQTYNKVRRRNLMAVLDVAGKKK